MHASTPGPRWPPRAADVRAVVPGLDLQSGQSLPALARAARGTRSTWRHASGSVPAAASRSTARSMRPARRFGGTRARCSTRSIPRARRRVSRAHR
jgi:hypothetical protein